MFRLIESYLEFVDNCDPKEKESDPMTIGMVIKVIRTQASVSSRIPSNSTSNADLIGEKLFGDATFDFT